MAALLLALLLAVPARDPGRALAQRVQAFYAHTRDFSASFRQHYTYVAIGRTEDSEGLVQVKKPGLVRWDYASPDRRTLYIEGRTLWIWRPDDQEAQVKRDFGGEQLSSAFTFLWGKGNLLKEFSPKSVPVPPGLPPGDGLELTPLKPVAGVPHLLLVVAKDGHGLTRVVTNPQGNTHHVLISQPKIDHRPA